MYRLFGFKFDVDLTSKIQTYSRNMSFQMGLKLREKYLLLGIGLFTLFGLGCLLIALRRDNLAVSNAPIRDVKNRWAAQHGGENEFERIQREMLINASKDQITERRNFIKGVGYFMVKLFFKKAKFVF